MSARFLRLAVETAPFSAPEPVGRHPYAAPQSPDSGWLSSYQFW